MRYILLIFIKLYQWLISPLLGNNCRHIPSCSEYTFEAIKSHGAVKGIGIAEKAFANATHGSEAKFDPVPKKLTN